MNKTILDKLPHNTWRLPKRESMRVDAIVYADETLLDEMEEGIIRQLTDVANLPGVAGPVYAMPDAHVGYGFPIGGVAAMDERKGGVVSAGGVGFDIACGVRALITGIHVDDIRPQREKLARQLALAVPAGLGSGGRMRLNNSELDHMLARGAAWAVDQGNGKRQDLQRMESRGTFGLADPDAVSAKAKDRMRDEMGSLGSGNHYLEVQVVDEIYDEPAANAFDLRRGDCVVAIHCGSRGLGHQVATDYSREMLDASKGHKLRLPSKELACAPIASKLGQRYLAAHDAAANCALANRQVLTHGVRQVFAALFGPGVSLPLLYDVCHNTCRAEDHPIPGVNNTTRRLHVHRKGATRALPPKHPDLPPELAPYGQPVLIGGSMGTASYVLAGVPGSLSASYASACHGAGRILSRSAAKKRYSGREVLRKLHEQGIEAVAASAKSAAEEAPGAYKDVDRVVAVTHAAGLARPVARLMPVVSIKG
ncbi:MAG: RtcB family protein [Okeania sp. SIO3B3]|nr:RtcB family protein [Okeania sp. SIO3B3]